MLQTYIYIAQGSSCEMRIRCWSEKLMGKDHLRDARRWNDNTEINLIVVTSEGVKIIRPIQDRVLWHGDWLTFGFRTSRKCLGHVNNYHLSKHNPTLSVPRKVKVKLSLCFNWAPRHEGVLAVWRYSSTHSSTSALDGGEWSAWRPSRFTPRERAPGIQWIGGWVGPRAVLDVVVKRSRGSKPRTPIVQPAAQRYTDWAITAPVSAPLPYIIRVTKSRRMRGGRACSTHGRDEKSIQNFGRKPEGKRPFRRSKHRY
jgi:hypothetical protein